MAWFGQGRDTIEWQEFRDDVLFYKWKNNEIKKGSKLIIRPGQHAIFFAGGKIEGIFKEQGTFDIDTQIVPFLSSLSGLVSLRKDTGLRAEVYFVNSKELLLKWGTRQRIMIPTVEVPSGIPVGCNGNLVIEFRDYVTFIHKIAGVKSTYSLSDIQERIMGELGGIIAESILDNHQPIGMNALVSLQANNRKLAKSMKEELDKELLDIGLGVRDLNIISINYPEDVQKMAEKVAGHSFVTDTAKYANIHMAEGFSQPGGGNIGAMGAQMAVGAQMAQQMTQQMQQSQNNQQAAPQGAQDPSLDRFCPKCRVMRSGKFCSECGTETV
jgi:membrane protease subunit (stomatin/prohibitin family)